MGQGTQKGREKQNQIEKAGFLFKAAFNKQDEGKSAYFLLTTAETLLRDAGLDLKADQSYREIGTSKAEFDSIKEQGLIITAKESYDWAKQKAATPGYRGYDGFINLQTVERLLTRAGLDVTTDFGCGHIGTTAETFAEYKSYLGFCAAAWYYDLAKDRQDEQKSFSVCWNLAYAKRHLQDAGYDLESEELYKAFGATKGEFYSLWNRQQEESKIFASNGLKIHFS